MKTCGHTEHLHDVPWSDAQECSRCGWHSYETAKERVKRLQCYVEKLRGEITTRKGDNLESEARALEAELDPDPEENW